MGYDAVELAIEEPAEVNPLKIKELLEKYELKVAVCGAFGPSRDLTADDAALQQNSLEYIEACLEICSILETGFFAGPMYSAVGKARMVADDQRKTEWERAVTNLRKVCAMAAGRGLEIALEPLNRFESDLVNTAEDAMKLIRDIGHPAAKMVLDGFHMSIEESGIANAITTAGDKLIHLQVSENHRGIPGTGQTDWAACYRGLQSIGYQGMVSIESFTPDNKELAAAVCVWKALASDQDRFARDGLTFLREWASGKPESVPV